MAELLGEGEESIARESTPDADKRSLPARASHSSTTGQHETSNLEAGLLPGARVITIRRITGHDAALLREVRLRALSDSPMAFGSTYAREVAFDQTEWQARATRLSSSNDAATFLAFDDQTCCGIIGCFRETDRPNMAAVVSMWVAPEVRRNGVGAS
jgi:hypothetical protein